MILPRKLSAIFFIASAVMAFLLMMLLLVGNADTAEVKGKRLGMRHSSLLSLVECDGYTVVDVDNPWGEGLLQRYILVPEENVLPASLPDGTLLRTPVRRALLFSGVHTALFEELGVAEYIKAVCDAGYVYSKITAAAIAEGRVVDCGSSLDVNLERVAEASPDAIFVLPFENGGYGKLDRLRIPLVECADYMESSPLGCAEWVRFYGRLVGKGDKYDTEWQRMIAMATLIGKIISYIDPDSELICDNLISSINYELQKPIEDDIYTEVIETMRDDFDPGKASEITFKHFEKAYPGFEQFCKEQYGEE